MKIAYLVFAYKNPLLIQREIERLSSENAGFFIHIDSKHDIGPFTAIRGNNVQFTKERIPVHWAEFSGVRAMMLLMREALQSPENYDYLFLLSGSEYPIRSRRYIEDFFEANRGSEFIRIIRVPGPGKPLKHFTTVRYESDTPVLRFSSRALAKIGLSQRDYRKYLGAMEPWSGRTWWALSRQACEYILAYTEQNPQLAKFFKDTHAPEESYFHTILGNSDFRNRVRGNLVYEDWSEGGLHPQMISERHLAFFEANEKVFDLYEGPSELLFARKFSDDSVALLDRLDQMAAQKDAWVAQ